MRELLWPLVAVYAGGTQLRNWLYDQEVLRIHRFPVPIVSVGNLTMGGTGKTPIISELVAWAVKNNLRPAIISRGYKSESHEPRRVLENSAHRYGDEPTLLAQKFPSVPIYVGADRVQVVEKLLSEEKVDMIFADDAFQHRRMGRSVDILVVDATEKLENYRILPVGRARESIAAISRADFIIINKCNLVTPEEKKAVLQHIEVHVKSPSIPLIECEYAISHFTNLSTDAVVEIPTGRPPAVLLSAIGNPKSFELLLNKQLDVRGHLIFRDHHHFSPPDVEKVLSLARAQNAKWMITTEKDAVKLRGWGTIDNFYVAHLMLKPSLRFKLIHEFLIQLRH